MALVAQGDILEKLTKYLNKNRNVSLFSHVMTYVKKKSDDMIFFFVVGYFFMPLDKDHFSANNNLLKSER